ncbi:MAG: ribosome-associated translation inhibitor RaiA [Gammaproteobacteria bacterium]|nr:ribosome-associated translation inhibitor RaiA [Gammaproteobacteria bacterium]
MQISVSGQHLEITTSLRDYITGKLERLERHFDKVTKAHVILSVEKLRQKAEATLHIRGADIFAEAENENMYAAIDALMDKLDRQVKKHKEKRSNHHRGNSLAMKATIEE